jgi:hypothetical protein
MLFLCIKTSRLKQSHNMFCAKHAATQIFLKNPWQ